MHVVYFGGPRCDVVGLFFLIGPRMIGVSDLSAANSVGHFPYDSVIMLKGMPMPEMLGHQSF